jgi:hypothetical protein
MAEQIIINSINFEDPRYKNKTQYTTNLGYHAYTLDDKGTKVYKYVMEREKDKNGKLKVRIDEDGNAIYKRDAKNQKIPVLTEVVEETQFVFNRWAGTTSAEHTPSEKRDSLKLNHYPDQPACEDIKETFNKYDSRVSESRKDVFDKYDKLFTYVKCNKIPDEEDDMLMDASAKKYPKFANSKLKLQKIYTYHDKHTGERFDEINERIISKAIMETLEDKTKSRDNLSIVLSIKNEETGKLEKKSYLFKDDIEDRCVFGTIVKFCKAENVSESTKKPCDCTEEEIEELYGKLEQVDVQTPEDLDKYYTANCYVRYLFAPTKLWAAKNKDATGKKNFGIIFTCYQLHIIQIPNKKMDSSSSLTTKQKFETHTFGQKSTLSRTASSTSDKTESKKVVQKVSVDVDVDTEGTDDAEGTDGVSDSGESDTHAVVKSEPVQKVPVVKSAPAPAPAPAPSAVTKKIAKKIVVEVSESEEEEDQESESSEEEEEVIVETKKKTSTKTVSKTARK